MNPSIEIRSDALERAVARCRERHILIPTFAQQRDPSRIPAAVRQQLPGVGLQDVNSLNLFRITWKNDVETGLFGGVNVVEFPPELTGVPSRIFGLVGKFFPTGAHKVGATFGCLVPRLVTGQFDPTMHKAVWPSTGNFCRGGAYNAALLACDSVAILPEEMSRERFEWLEAIGSEVIATPGCESNVKEIYDKCWELRETRPDAVILNQFEEFGNGMWHYQVTAAAIEEVFAGIAGARDRLFAYVSATGSAGTISAGNALKKAHPTMKVVATEALQCPTLLENGFGGHRIEGIGDKHVPWIHDVRSTDVVAAIDDSDCMAVLRLFNEEAGRDHLRSMRKLPRETVDSLGLLGISSICNLIGCIKTARYFETGPDDVFFTVLTDSVEMYRSRLREIDAREGPYDATRAAVDWAVSIGRQGIDHLLELSHVDRRRIHNLKYYTWIEQQGKTSEELEAQWSRWPDYFEERFNMADAYDRLIEEFNRKTGLAPA